MEHLNFTQKALDAIPFTTAGQVVYRDTTLNVLYLKVGTTKKTWFIDRKLDGRSTKVSIGDARFVSASLARERAQALIVKMLTDRPSFEARKVTLMRAWESYQKDRNLKPKTLHGYDYSLRQYLSDWLGKPLTTITPAMVRERHRKIGEENGPATSNLVMRVFRAIWNHASVDLEADDGSPILQPNPVNRISAKRGWFKVERRRTYIKPEQIASFMDALDELESQVAADWIRFLLFSGLRRDEALWLRRDSVDLPGRTLTILDTKNNEPHILPLSGPLVELLERRMSGASDWVFSNPQSPSERLTWPDKSIVRARELSGIYFAAHDLRRTFITVAESLDISPYTIKRLVNHKMTGDVTAGYVVPNVERLREPMQRIAEEILRLRRPPVAALSTGHPSPAAT